MEPRRARQQAWVRSVWPDSQRLQRCRSRGLVFVTATKQKVVPVATMSVGTQTVHPLWQLHCALSLPNPGWTVGFCGNRPVEIKKYWQRGFKLYFFENTFLLAPRRRRRDCPSRAETGRTCYMPLAQQVPQSPKRHIRKQSDPQGTQMYQRVPFTHLFWKRKAIYEAIRPTTAASFATQTLFNSSFFVRQGNWA
jgi:hypothetical protein